MKKNWKTREKKTKFQKIENFKNIDFFPGYDNYEEKKAKYEEFWEVFQANWLVISALNAKMRTENTRNDPWCMQNHCWCGANDSLPGVELSSASGLLVVHYQHMYAQSGQLVRFLHS